MTNYVLPKQIQGNTKSLAAYTRIYENLLSEIDNNTHADLFIRIGKATRSIKQNSYLWAVVYPTIRIFMADNHNQEYSDEAIHEATKEMFLPSRVEQWASREVKVYRSTAKLTKQEFADYLDQVFAWAGGFGCSIPEPSFSWKEEETHNG